MRSDSLSIAFQTNKPITAYGPLASTVEAYGFDGVTVYNDMLYQPAWLPLLEMARATSKVRIGPAAVNPFTCHPINMAGHIALIDEMAGGRAYLGIARGGWLDFVGIQPQDGISALREAFGCVRHLLRQSTEPYEGKIFSLAGGDSLRWVMERTKIPFLLGSWGIKTISACLDLVDEVKIGGTANPLVAPYYRRQIELAAQQANVEAGSTGIVVGAVTVVDRDGQAARSLARREVALYLPLVAQLDPTLTLDPELLARIQAAAEQYDFEQAAALISDDVLGYFALAGTPDEVAARAQELFDAGTSRVEFGTPHGLTTEGGLRLLGEYVLPALRG